MPSAFQPFASGSSWNPPAGARRNDLSSGNLPYNLWGAAATNSANKAFGNTNQIQSYTMPGTMQSFNGLTGQARSQQTPSWDGNNAYMPVSQRAGPVSWNMTGWNGQQGSGQQGWQQLANQRDAFAGGLIQRLGEYQSGRQSGQPTFDFQDILNKANKSLQSGTWRNPFANPRAGNATPTMTTPGAFAGFGDDVRYPPRMSPDLDFTFGPPPIIAPDLNVDWRDKRPDPDAPPEPRVSAGWRRPPAPGEQEVGYQSRPPSQWTDQDWSEYTAWQNAPVRRDIGGGGKGYYRDSEGRARYARGYGYYPDGQATEDADAAWQRAKSFVPPQVPTFYA